MQQARERLRGLREDFAERLPVRYEELETTLTAFLEAEDQDELRTLQRHAHNLMGSAPSYGYAEIGKLAAKLEGIVSTWLEGGDVDDRLARRHLGAMRRAIHESTRSGTVASPERPVLPPARTGSRLVYLLDDDEESARRVVEQLRPYGYRVTAYDDAASVLDAVRREAPAALVLNVASTQGDWRAASALDLTTEARGRVPVVFLAAHGDLDSRLAAVRAGAAAYLTTPPDIDQIVEFLDRLTLEAEPDPYRVLVVDDSTSTAEFYAASLEAVGMVTALAGGATEAMAAIEDFSPEIILLDLYMPDVDGYELAQVIRQYPSLVSIPIVFVSAETDEGRQVAALGHGGDDFLTKPVNVKTLQSSVRVRAQRHRQLRASMHRDSLTGLLNHRSSKESLDSELARAARLGTPVSVAMLDIDHFKAVNDTHGHLAGDVVLKSLARILTQRLRRSDVVGRYGGEEFLVVMPDTAAEQAAAVLDQLRLWFGALTHQDDGDTFSCSMSIGLTETRPGESTDDVLRRADDALYAAKQRGRDRIERA